MRKTEILTIIAKTKNRIDHGLDKSEVYEIVRKKQHDEKSRIIELRKISKSGLDFVNMHPDSVGLI